MQNKEVESEKREVIFFLSLVKNQFQGKNGQWWTYKESWNEMAWKGNEFVTETFSIQSNVPLLWNCSFRWIDGYSEQNQMKSGPKEWREEKSNICSIHLLVKNKKKKKHVFSFRIQMLLSPSFIHLLPDDVLAFLPKFLTLFNDSMYKRNIDLLTYPFSMNTQTRESFFPFLFSCLHLQQHVDLLMKL